MAQKQPEFGQATLIKMPVFRITLGEDLPVGLRRHAEIVTSEVDIVADDLDMALRLARMELRSVGEGGYRLVGIVQTGVIWVPKEFKAS